MNNASRTRRLIAASLVLLGLAANVSQAQTVVSVNGVTCANATVTLGAGSININTASCGGAVALAPTISSLSLTNGLPGDPVTINGANLSGASVTIGGVSASVSSNSGTQIFTSVPTGATVGGVVVNTGVAPNASAAFTVNAPATVPPTITSLSVASGALGTALTISGTNLSGASVIIGSATASVISNNGLQITTTVPSGAVLGVGTVIVTTAVTPAASAVFTVLAPPPPTISSVSPITGGVGTLVTISGTGFIGASVTIGGATAVITTSSATSISTSVPAGAVVGAGNIVVTTAVLPAASFGFTVTVGDVSTDGNTIPNPSKRPTSVSAAQPHAGLNGAGLEILAYAMPPTRCLTTPALTRSWQHNINFAEYKIGAVDNFVMNPGESLSYKFTVDMDEVSGGFNYGESAQSGGNIRPAFLTVTSAPCDFDVSKVVDGPLRNACYQTGLNGVLMIWAVTAQALPVSYCRLVKGQTYYMNIRFQDARPASQGGTPTQDSCTGACGGAIQVS